MANHIHHLHIKSLDPEATTAWYVRAFNFAIRSSRVRPGGDLIFHCQAEGGMLVTISGPRTGETLPAGSAGTRLGLEHFGMTTDDIEADIKRLEALGAVLVDGPNHANGFATAFVTVPGDVRIELVQEARQGG